MTKVRNPQKEESKAITLGLNRQTKLLFLLLNKMAYQQTKKWSERIIEVLLATRKSKKQIKFSWQYFTKRLMINGQS
ncbi:hypothetical protein SQ11_01975 [Nitrosospira sp. NpAV]|nr:hypothetical protein SQ11_01975 [Nitrosospira sp. NpAV]